ncbi:MAG: chemotaxis protein CheW [bacterium]
MRSRRIHRNGDKKKEIIEKPKDNPALNQEKGFAIFAIGSEWYCVDLDSIFEILHNYEITAVSHLPDFFEGTTNLRGESIPVVNLRKLLNLSPGNQDFQVCIICTSDGIKIGFLVDSDIEIVKSSEVQIFPLPDCYGPDEQKFLDGIVEHKDRLIGVLKLNQALKILAERRSNEDK